jgi:hypothetical protein
MIDKTTAKRILGEVPYAAEAYWYLRQAGKPPRTGYKLEPLPELLPFYRDLISKNAQDFPPGKNILLFASLHYWIVHATILGAALAGLNHKVTIAYLPYSSYDKPVERFDIRRQNIYTNQLLRQAEPILNRVSFFDLSEELKPLPETLDDAIQEVAYRDAQYILQNEVVDFSHPVFLMRLERANLAAHAAYIWLNERRPDVFIIPNGTILEPGAVYQVAKYLGIPIVTYEFGEQRQRIWTASDTEVMHQKTEDLWAARGGNGLKAEQEEMIRDLFAARQRADLWQNFARRWQGIPSVGGEKTRTELGLDNRPIILLATNVIGDSLTLGRQVFSDSMTNWLERTVSYFAHRSDVQFIVRIHPGELITKGPSVAEVVKQALPLGLPENIHLVPADGLINTYDLIEIADLGMVYTTTVGLEMAMSGVPVIVVGQTHYRGKGFTLDPESWQGYYDLLDHSLANLDDYRLSEAQIKLAWEYAYLFFFEYPHPFPWHLLHMKEDLQEWPLERVLSSDGQALFARTFRYLTGDPVDWTQVA